MSLPPLKQAGLRLPASFVNLLKLAKAVGFAFSFLLGTLSQTAMLKRYWSEVLPALDGNHLNRQPPPTRAAALGIFSAAANLGFFKLSPTLAFLT